MVRLAEDAVSSMQKVGKYDQKSKKIANRAAGQVVQYKKGLQQIDDTRQLQIKKQREDQMIAVGAAQVDEPLERTKMKIVDKLHRMN